MSGQVQVGAKKTFISIVIDLECLFWTDVLCQVEMVNIKQKLSLHPSWAQFLNAELETPQMKSLLSYLESERAQGKEIYPKPEDFFAALNHTPFEKTKVVIVGQDPYHGPGQAHGLSFSVNPGIKFPPSLRNIFKELESDLGHKAPDSGSLLKWADQGVLLLNAVLSVEGGKANSHQKKGWEEFTDKIIHLLNERREHLVFILWGSYAQKKGAFIDRQRHLVLEAVHPSPLSAHRGFFGTKPFSTVNDYLRLHHVEPIDWEL